MYMRNNLIELFYDTRGTLLAKFVRITCAQLYVRSPVTNRPFENYYKQL